MSERFFVPSLDEFARIDGVEAHHLLHVLRAKRDDRIVLFDGSGREAIARIVDLRRSEVDAEILELREVDREAAIRLEIAMPLPKGDRAGFLVEKLTELGVARLTPIESRRSVSSAGSAGKAEKPEKLLRRSIDACKQCGRNRLLEIGEPVAFAPFVASERSGTRWIADASGTPIVDASREAFRDGVALVGEERPRVTVLVGPEGGFESEELDAARDAGWRAVGLGRTVLRMETAAVAIAALVLAAGR